MTRSTAPKRQSRRAAALLAAATIFAVPATGHPAASAAPPPPGQQAETARRLLQHAVHLEEAVGDPEAAIAAYEDAIASPEADAPVTAVAELRLALLLDRVGRGREAREIHRRITDRYAGDPRLIDVVRLSRAALGDTAGGNGTSMVARRLWAGSEAYAYGSLAPDGSYLSFVDWVSGNLAVHDLDRESKRYLTHMDRDATPETWACSTAVAPDGARIAYTLYREDSGHEIRLVHSDGSGDRLLLAAEGHPRHIELEGWSADGAALVAVVFEKDATSRLALVSMADGTLETVRELEAPAPESVSMSPDGRWLAYHREAPVGGHDILVAPIAGGDPTPLVTHPANDLFPLWAPDGRHLLFVSDRTGGLAAWAVAVEEGVAAGDARLIKSDFGRSLPMGFTDHGALIYAVQASLEDVYTAKLYLPDGKIGEREVASGRYVGVNRAPAWSADGRHIAYLSDRGPLPAGMAPTSVVVRDERTGEERSLTIDLRRPVVPRWQSDAEAIWMEARDPDEGWGIYRVRLEGGAAERFAGWDGDFCACAGAPAVSESHVAYLEPHSKDHGRLVVHALADGSERSLGQELAPADLRGLRFSPDGSRLAAAVRRRDGERRGTWALEIIDPLTGATRRAAELGADGEAVEIVGWLRPNKVLAALREDGDRRLLVVNVDTGSSELLPAPLPGDVRELSLHPEGERLVFTAGAYRAEIWMLENPLAPLSGHD